MKLGVSGTLEVNEPEESLVQTAKMPVTSAGGNKIATCFWFNDQAKEAADFFISLFNSSPHASKFAKSSIISVSRTQEGVTNPCNETETGKVFSVMFLLAGYEILALNGEMILVCTVL